MAQHTEDTVKGAVRALLEGGPDALVSFGQSQAQAGVGALLAPLLAQAREVEARAQAAAAGASPLARLQELVAGARETQNQVEGIIKDLQQVSAPDSETGERVTQGVASGMLAGDVQAIIGALSGFQAVSTAIATANRLRAGRQQLDLALNGVPKLTSALTPAGVSAEAARAAVQQLNTLAGKVNQGIPAAGAEWVKQKLTPRELFQEARE